MCMAGTLGAGKTLSAVYAGLRHFFRHGRKIFSNITLFGIPFYRVDSFDDMNKIKGNPRSNVNNPLDFKQAFSEAVFIGDELWMYAMARVSKAVMNRIVNLILAKSRKRGITILYTSQDPKQVDKFIRTNTDLYGYPVVSPDMMTCRIMIMTNQMGKLQPYDHWTFRTVEVMYHYNSWEEAPDFKFKDDKEISLEFYPIWVNPCIERSFYEFQSKIGYPFEYLKSLLEVTIFNSTTALLKRLPSVPFEEDEYHLILRNLAMESEFKWLTYPRFKYNDGDKNDIIKEYLETLQNEAERITKGTD